MCNNTQGFYVCTCKEGFYKDGQNCTGKLKIQLFSVKLSRKPFSRDLTNISFPANPAKPGLFNPLTSSVFVPSGFFFFTGPRTNSAAAGSPTGTGLPSLTHMVCLFLWIPTKSKAGNVGWFSFSIIDPSSPMCVSWCVNWCHGSHVPGDVVKPRLFNEFYAEASRDLLIGQYPVFQKLNLLPAFIHLSEHFFSHKLLNSCSHQTISFNTSFFSI